MSEQTQVSAGRMAAWRERRRAKRQERIEALHHQHEQARSSGRDLAYDELGAATRGGHHATPWIMSGAGDFGGGYFGGGGFGDGGCGGDGGGGGC